MSKFTPLKGSCPVCAGHRKDCRQSNSTKLIHCRDSAASPTDYIFKSLDKWGFGIWANRAEQEFASEQQREEWKQQRERERQQRLQEETRQRAQLLGEAERDREIHKLLGQLPLNQAHRADLHRRGLTDEQIQAGMFRSVQRWQKLSNPVSHRLAGVNITGRGLTNAEPGYLCPIWNEKEQIIGWQLRLDNTDDGGKYRWPTSASKKRPEGPTAHLQNGELPLTYCKPLDEVADKSIGLAEGILKPWIASQKRKQIILGAAGGNFASSSQTFKRHLDAASAELGGATKCILYADAGAISNRHVVQQYKATAKLAKQFGYEVQVGWWGQTTKDAPDIDELPAETEIETITFAQFLNLVANAAWQGQKAFHSFKDLVAQIVGHVPKPLERQQKESSPVECTAIVPYTGVQILRIDPTVDTLPTFEQWLEMGQPKLIFKAGTRKETVLGLYRNGFPAVCDRSLVGTGKSHDSGSFTRNDFGLPEFDDEGKDIGGRIFHIAADHKNPTTKTVEENSENLIDRHNGETVDYSRRTPLGEPYRTRTAKGKLPDIPGNCPETDTFILAANEKDGMIFGGKGSPICERCPHFAGCEFLTKRRDQLKSKVTLRAHINQLGSARGNDIGIIDEPGTQLEATKTLTIDKASIADTAHQLHAKDRHGYRLIKTTLEVILECLYGLTDIPAYGFSHVELLTLLATKADPMRLKFWERYQHHRETFEHPLAGILRNRLEKDFLQSNPDASAWDIPGLSDLEKQLSNALANDWAAIFEGCQTPEQKQQAIRARATLNWLSPLIRVISGLDKFTDIRINSKGQIELTRRSFRHQHTLKGFGFLLLMDATISKADLARKTGIKNICEIEQEIAPETFNNLTIKVVKGLGRNAKGTSEETTWKRIYAAIQAAIEKRPTLAKEQRAIVTFKNDVERFKELDAVTGYWHRDSRGNNRFIEVEQLLVHGLPKPNLAAKASEWHSVTGQTVKPTDLSGRFGSWYNAQVVAEIVQCLGRPRAHLRPDCQIEAVLMAGDALSLRDIATIRQAFPGCKIEIVEAYDLAPAAAAKGTQKARGMIEAAWSAIGQGGDASRSAIAKILALSPGRISQLAKEACGKTFSQLVEALGFLYKAIKGKLTLSELDEETRWVAETYLPLVAEVLTTNPLEAVEEVAVLLKSYGAEKFGQILAGTEPWVLCKLLGGVMQAALNLLVESPPMEAPG
ncbi:hypothetical protein [Argonema antarcticum]|uniref:hypothetical protein n=1 Tax=Argonema antarcticum TaxID=2942763 RepID=UPI0020121554|nr:hypothetical protein [Argonema antarcticum]MCL1475704.1 hypothetical protein [Argonema antarcticum A004/B2]